MGKGIREKQSSTSQANNINPGRVWGILHVIKYHNWHHVKKKLSHKKHGGGKNDAIAGNPGTTNDSEFDNMQEPNTTPSSVHSTPSAKHSIKSRIKSLIAEEISRKKGHKRSSTCPAPVKSQLSRAGSIHHLEHDPLNELLLNVENPEPVLETSEKHHADDTLDAQPPVLSEKPTANNDKSADSGTIFSSGNWEQNEIHRHQKQDEQKMLNQGVPEERQINAKILTTDASSHHYKDFHDTLDIINSNKDFVLKYLRDPGSPLPYHFHNQKEFNDKMRRTKSISLPVSGSSSGTMESEPGEVINKMVDEWFNGKGESQLEIQNHMEKVSQSESSEDFHQHSKSSGSSHEVDRFLNPDKEKVERDHNSLTVSSQVPNQVVTRHFKDLRKKIRHLISESKNESRRITMDAILDKVPRGGKLSKNVKKLIHDQSIDHGDITSCYGSRSFNKRQLSSMRTKSLKESAGKYSQLYETCFNKDIKYPKTDKLKVRTQEKSPILKTPKSFRRVLSMPNLKSNIHQSEDPPSVFLSPQNSMKQLGERTPSKSVTDEQRSFDHSNSKSQVLPHTHAENTFLENILNSDQKQLVVMNAAKSGSDVNDEAKAKANESIKIDGLENLRESDDGFACNEQDTGPAIESTPMMAKENSISLSDSSFLDDTIDFEKFNVLEDYELKPGPGDGLDNMAEQQEAKVDDPEVAGSGENFQKLRIPSTRFNYGFPRIEVDPSNEDEFKYVRDVLELSGFTDSKSLGKWSSDDQPVDPSVYEELQGRLLSDPDCSGKCDKGGQCNHMLLFDLINEGLLEIFGRSYSYYPKPLSSLCNIHPLPAGDHVLQKLWTLISWYLKSGSEAYPSLDYYVSRDLEKDDGWMNLQFDSECVGLELDDLIFDELLEEIIST